MTKRFEKNRIIKKSRGRSEVSQNRQKKLLYLEIEWRNHARRGFHRISRTDSSNDFDL